MVCQALQNLEKGGKECGRKRTGKWGLIMKETELRGKKRQDEIWKGYRARYIDDRNDGRSGDTNKGKLKKNRTMRSTHSCTKI